MALVVSILFLRFFKFIYLFIFTYYFVSTKRFLHLWASLFVRVG